MSEREPITCTRCEGLRGVVCQACDGDGCEACDGDGDHPCPACNPIGDLGMTTPNGEHPSVTAKRAARSAMPPATAPSSSSRTSPPDEWEEADARIDGWVTSLPNTVEEAWQQFEAQGGDGDAARAPVPEGKDG